MANEPQSKAEEGIAVHNARAGGSQEQTAAARSDAAGRDSAAAGP